jgi:hypothetical protein
LRDVLPFDSVTLEGGAVQPVGAFVGRELKWVRPSLTAPAYELLHVEAGSSRDELVGTLRFRSSWGTLATAESGDGCWTFKRIGFLQTRVTIRTCTADAVISDADSSEADSEANTAVFDNNSWTGGGTLELPDGREYRANSNFWMTKFGFTTAEGEPLVGFRQIGGLLKLSSTVEIYPGAATIPELPWLVMLGWYLTVLLHRDASA